MCDNRSEELTVTLCFLIDSENGDISGVTSNDDIIHAHGIM